MEKFVELTRVESHLGLNPRAMSGEGPGIPLETERFQLGLKVLDLDHAPLSQEFLKRGCPASLRGSVWSQVLGSQVTEKETAYYEELKEAVISNDIMVDKLIFKVVFKLKDFFNNFLNKQNGQQIQ